MRLFAQALAATLLTISLMPAQTGSSTDTRSVVGIVQDRRGNPLPGAVVQIKNERTLAVASAITRQDGAYTFQQLNTDTYYSLQAHYRKYWSKSKELTRFNTAKVAKIDLEVEIE